MTPVPPHPIRSRLVDILRLFLGFALLPYGFGKLANVQFPHTLAFFDATVLLLWRRTWPLGAVVYLMVIVNVLLIDLCYRVWLSGTLMAAFMTAGILLLISLERNRLLHSVHEGLAAHLRW